MRAADPHGSSLWLGAIIAAVASVAACAEGGTEAIPPSTTGTGGSAANGGGGEAGSGGQGGQACPAAQSQACYDGPEGTEGVGHCQAGAQICAADGSQWGICEGQVVPTSEDCALRGDEDCDAVGCADPLWALLAGDSTWQQATDLAVDSSGSIVVVGEFEGAIEFGSELLISQGASDIFVVKLDSTGAVSWAMAVGDVAEQTQPVVAIDSSDHVVVGGAYEGSVNFGPDGQTELSAPAGTTDIFLAKLDADGVHQWSRYLTGRDTGQLTIDPTGRKWPSRIAIDDADEILVAGYFDGHWGGHLVPNPPVSAQGFAGFVRKLDAAGATLWARDLDGPGSDHVYDASVDPGGNIAIAGHFETAVDLGNGVVLAETPGSHLEGFVAALNASGDTTWADPLGPVGAPDGSRQAPYAVVRDVAGVYVAGAFSGAIDLAGTVLADGDGAFDAFVASYDLGGTMQWHRSFSAPDSQNTRALAKDGAGQLVLGGCFQGQLGITDPPLVAAGSLDSYVAKLDADGTTRWARRYGDSGASCLWALAVAADHRIALCGTTNGTIDFGFGPLTTAGDSDVFVVLQEP